MQDQDDILEALNQRGEMSTFDFRNVLGVYPRRLLNSILLDAGLVEKSVKDRRVHWKITDEGISILNDKDKVDTFANMTTLEVAQDIAMDIKEVEAVAEERKEGWMKRFKKRLSKK